MWRIDTTQTGIEIIMKPYQYGIITHILDKKENITSGDMHAHLEFQGYTISRASVINYLKKLAESGIIYRKEETGKGGYHGVYSAKLSFEEILTQIVNSAMDSLLVAFPDSDFVKYMVNK